MVMRLRSVYLGLTIVMTSVAAARPGGSTIQAERQTAQSPAITCEVEGQTSIFSIIPDGSIVEEGQLVCELDPTSFKEELSRRRIVVAAVNEACREATKAREAAEIAAAEYENAIARQDTAAAEGEVKLAQSDLTRAADRLDWARKMEVKGFLGRAQRVSEELNLQKARFALEQAETKVKVLQGYTKPRTIKELKSEIAKAHFDEKATNRVLELEKAKMSHLQQQIDRCRIFSPSAGKLVYVRLRGQPKRPAETFPRPGLRVRQGEILARVIPGPGQEAASEIHGTARLSGPTALQPTVLRSPIEGETTVLSILPVATAVTQGQVVCELDASDLNDELTAQKLLAGQAEYDLGARINVLEIAKLSLQEYQEGQYALDKSSLEGEIKIARAELDLADKELAQARKDVGADSLAAHRSEVARDRVQLQLDQALARLRVLQNLTHPRQTRSLEMGVEHAGKEVELAKKRLNLEHGKATHLERLIALCKVVSLTDGKVAVNLVSAGQIVKEGQPLLAIEATVKPGNRTSR